jgi:Family of unknown function (DUF6444)
MDRAEAEAIYDAGREVCVQFLLDLAGQVAQLEERLTRLEAAGRQDSLTSSKPPSMDPPKTRAQRRADARAKAKELMRREGEQRKPGGRAGIAALVASSSQRIRSMRSSITTRGHVVGVVASSSTTSAVPSGGSAAIRLPSCRRSVSSPWSTARISCVVGLVVRGPVPGCPRRSVDRRSGRGCRQRS